MRIYSPGTFQGKRKKSGYFEGWYFKCISAAENSAAAIIPGIAAGIKGKDSHSFIQVLDGITGEYSYIQFPFEAFSYSTKGFSIAIGENRFSERSCVLSIKNPPISGELNFDNLKPWPVKTFSPGAMGWFAFLPFMEDYHGILSFSHRITGTLKIRDRVHDFKNGKGYIEKDWGRSFPENWIWMQSNHFSDESASISVSIAKIPWGKKYFTGFIAGFLFKNTLYKWCTYTGAKIIDLKYENSGTVSILIEDRKNRIRIRAVKIGGTRLKAPKQGDMGGHVNESLTSNIHVELYTKIKNSWENIFEDKGRMAGLEIHGRVQHDKQWKSR